MIQAHKVLAFLTLTAALLLVPTKAAAQNVVTPTLMPAPAGQLIVVNNGPGDQSDPHVSGNLVSYSDNSPVDIIFTIHYHDLGTGSDLFIPQPSGVMDFLADVSGSTVAFTRVSADRSAIFTFDTSVAGAQPIEIAPQAGSARQEAQIGTKTIAWQDHGFSSSSIVADIVAYDIATGTITRLANDMALNQAPAISPDGTVITWVKCATPAEPCDVWSATGSGTTWVTHQLTNGQGACSHPDTNGQVVVYSCDRGTGDQLYWQPVAGGTEQTMAPVLGQETAPSIAGQFVVFAGRQGPAFNHDIYVLDLSSLSLYQITNTPSIDEQLNDISITPDGRVNVVWQVPEADINVYAFSFNVPVADLAVHEFGLPVVLFGSAAPYWVEVQNLGPDTATNVVVSDALPAGFEYLGALGNCAGPAVGTNGTVTCNFGNLANGASGVALIGVRVTAPAGTTVANTVLVSADTIDPNLANNSATVDTRVFVLHEVAP
jgi:uncharacterized repeat protein (TIGR01451 family)